MQKYDYKTELLIYMYGAVMLLEYSKGFLPFSGVITSLIQYSLIAIGVLYILIQGYFETSPFLLWGILFLGVMFLSLAYCPNVNSAIEYSILPFIIKFLVYIVLDNIIRSKDEVDKLCDVYIAAGVIFSLMCFALYPKQLVSGNRFGYSVGRNPNEVMQQLIVPVCIILYRLFNGKNLLKYFLLAAPCFVVMISTGSKKVVFVMMFIVTFLFLREENNKIRTVLGILFILLLGYYALFNVDFLYNSVGARMETLIGFSSGNANLATESDIERSNMKALAMKYFKESPIWGKGCEGFRNLSPYKTYSHNNYTELLCCYGIIGTLFYYYFPLYYFFVALKSKYYRNSPINVDAYIIATLLLYFLMDWGCITTYAHYNMFVFWLVYKSWKFEYISYSDEEDYNLMYEE